jgi:hypothetical protein
MTRRALVESFNHPLLGFFGKDSVLYTALPSYSPSNLRIELLFKELEESVISTHKIIVENEKIKIGEKCFGYILRRKNHESKWEIDTSKLSSFEKMVWIAYVIENSEKKFSDYKESFVVWRNSGGSINSKSNREEVTSQWQSRLETTTFSKVKLTLEKVELTVIVGNN